MPEPKRFCITYYSPERFPFIEPKLSYLCQQQESCPTTGRLHWQVYVETTRPTSLEYFKKWVFKTTSRKPHILIASGLPSENKVYCSKPRTAITSTFTEDGIISEDKTGQGKRNDLVAIVDLVKEGVDVQDIITQIPQALKFLNHIERYSSLLKGKSKYKDHFEITYVWGPAGTGKSHYVYNIIKDLQWHRPLISGKNIWFEGYKGEDVLWLDDFDFRKFDREEMFHILDKYPVTVQCKGGSHQHHITNVYITSNVNPLYINDASFTRRLTYVINKTEVFKE